MLYHLLYPMGSKLILFNVFRYISFRAVMATLTALMISYLLGRPVVDYLRAFQIGQTVRDDGPKSHLEKSGTPTMGGLLILFAMTFSCLLWTRLDNVYFWIVLGVTLSYGAIGFLDDYLKVTKQSHRGLSGKRKLGLQLVIGCVVGFVLWMDPSFKTTLTVPFFKNFNPDLGIWYIPFVALVIAGASNAVNLTDGLDGLAIGPVMICGATYLLFAYVSGHLKLAQYLAGDVRPRFRRAGSGLRSHVGRGNGIPLVQHVSGRSVHGRCGLAVAGRFVGRDGSGDQAGDPFGDCRWCLCDRGCFGDPPGGLFQGHRQADLQHGAASSSLRA